MNTREMENYLHERKNRYLLQIENAKTFEDPDELMMGEAVLEEIDHLLTVFTLSPKRYD